MIILKIFFVVLLTAQTLFVFARHLKEFRETSLERSVRIASWFSTLLLTVQDLYILYFFIAAWFLGGPK